MYALFDERPAIRGNDAWVESKIFEIDAALRDLAHRVTETPIRGFWSYWAELMGMEPAGGIK